VLMYGIITAEKELMWSWIFDFLIAFISHRNGLDHSFDHLQLRTTWKQCPQEHPKAPFSDTKAPKSLINQEKICADLFGTSMPQVRILSLRPKFVLYALKISPFHKIRTDFLFIISNFFFCQKTTVFSKTLSFGTRHRFRAFFSFIFLVLFKIPFLLITAMQILRADDFSSALAFYTIQINWNLAFSIYQHRSAR